MYFKCNSTYFNVIFINLLKWLNNYNCLSDCYPLITFPNSISYTFKLKVFLIHTRLRCLSISVDDDSSPKFLLRTACQLCMKRWKLALVNSWWMVSRRTSCSCPPSNPPSFLRPPAAKPGARWGGGGWSSGV